MATIMDTPAAAGKRPGVRRAKRHHLKIDMTPMVDLGFLLIAFFVITTELSRPHTLDLRMPKDGPSMEVEDSKALTVLLDNENRIWYYHGEWSKAKEKGRVLSTTYDTGSGIGMVIREKQKYLDAAELTGNEGRDGLVLLIKPTGKASYGNVIDALDQALIGRVKKYMVAEPSQEELQFVQEKAAGN